MTDITDQYRRAARRWADHQLSLEVNDEGSVIAARVILATIPAPAPTLAEELRAEAPGVSGYDLAGVADRVEQIEQDRDEARAEVERLAATFKEHLKEPGHLPDPADVPEGEMWLIDTDYDKGLAGVRDEQGTWSVLSANGFARESEMEDDEATLVARLVPDTRRVIDRPEDLDALLAESVVLDKNDASSQKTPTGNWDCGYDALTAKELIGSYGPVTVIYVPEVVE